MKKFQLNLRNNLVVSFFIFLLFNTLFFNSHAKSNDEKIQNTEHKQKDAISKELEYLNKGIKYDYSKNSNKVELVTKKIDKPNDTSKDNAINKELEYLSKGIKYDYSENDNKVELVTKKIDKPESTSKDSQSIKYDYSKNSNKVELVTKKIDKPNDTSKDNAINKEIKYLNDGIDYEKRKNKLKGQIYLRADVGILKSQPKVYKDNFCVKNNNCDNKGYDAGKNYNFGIGWYINNDYRIDLLYNKANLKFDYKQQKGAKNTYYKHKVDISTLMLNLYRYKSISKYFDIYIGGGIGYTRISPVDGIITFNNQKDTYSAKPSNNFSYNLASGISFKVNNNAELNLGYRFLNYGKVKGFDSYDVWPGVHGPFSNVKREPLKGHNLSLGIIYKLPKK